MLFMYLSSFRSVFEARVMYTIDIISITNLLIPRHAQIYEWQQPTSTIHIYIDKTKTERRKKTKEATEIESGKGDDYVRKDETKRQDEIKGIIRNERKTEKRKNGKIHIPCADRRKQQRNNKNERLSWKYSEW